MHALHRRGAVASEPVDAPQCSDDDHQRGNARPRCGEHPRGDTEHVLAGRQVLARHPGTSRSEQHDAGAEPAEEDQPPPHDVTNSFSPRQQVDGAERQPRHVEHRPAEVEEPKAGQAPTTRLGPPQRPGAGGEQCQRHRPGQVVGPAPAQPAIQGAEGEADGDQRRSGGQCSVHAPDGTGDRRRATTRNSGSIRTAAAL